MSRGFQTRVGGILGGMVEAINNAVGAGKAEGGYVKSVLIRTGLLRREGLREAVKAATGVVNSLPMVIVCYVVGNDVLVDAGDTLQGTPRTYRHDAAFTVIVIEADTRGQQAQLVGTAGTPGVVKMVDDVREILGGVQFSAEDDGGEFDLNEWPLEPAGVEPIDQVPNVSAYAQHFLTNFFLTTPSRRVVAPVTIEAVNFGINVLNGASGHGGEPGVHAPGTD